MGYVTELWLSCYLVSLIAKPGNKTAAVPWPGPYVHRYTADADNATATATATATNTKKHHHQRHVRYSQWRKFRFQDDDIAVSVLTQFQRNSEFHNMHVCIETLPPNPHHRPRIIVVKQKYVIYFILFIYINTCLYYISLIVNNLFLICLISFLKFRAFYFHRVLFHWLTRNSLYAEICSLGVLL